MSKFCGQCGAQLDDNATFCTNCGANLGQSVQQSNIQQQNVQPNVVPGFGAVNNGAVAVKKGSKKTIAVVGVIAALVIILVVVLIIAFSLGGGYKAPLNSMKKALEKGDGKSVIRMSISDKYYKALKDNDDVVDEHFDGDVDDYFDNIGDQLLKSMEDRYGENIKVTYDIKKKKKIKKSDLEDYQDDLQSQADRIDLDDYEPKVTEGYELKVKLSVKGDDDKDSDTDDINVYKVDGDWVMEGQLGGLF